jgi:predicted O-linked N-acetylglucosamine transferase (SPINDLY family)
MGLPVLTRSGRTFASRMAGSLLTALELPELITDNLADYEQRAVELARDPEQLAALRQRLQQGRETSLLFDMPRFVRSFEDAVSTAYQHHR